MWKLFVFLLFIGVEIKGQDPDCEDCNIHLDMAFQDILPEKLLKKEPFETSIPDCEHCYVGGFTNVIRNNDSCVTEEEDYLIQITHFIIDSAMLNCSCDLSTKSGKKIGGIHGTIEKAMFSVKAVGSREEVKNYEFYEDGHIGAEKLHIKCDGDDDFKKACDEEEHSYNVDNVATAVGRSIVEILDSRSNEKEKYQLACFHLYGGGFSEELSLLQPRAY